MDRFVNGSEASLSVAAKGLWPAARDHRRVTLRIRGKVTPTTGRQAWIRLAIQVRDGSSLEAPFSYRELSRLLEHDPEKWVPVFPNATRLRGGSCSSKQIERDFEEKSSRSGTQHEVECRTMASPPRGDKTNFRVRNCRIFNLKSLDDLGLLIVVLCKRRDPSLPCNKGGWDEQQAL